MPVLTHPLPRVPDVVAREILAMHWGLSGTLRPLPGERERNFHVYTADGREFTLKIASSLEDPADIDLQVAALEFLATRLPAGRVPNLVPARDGNRVVSHTIDGEDHTARLQTWLPGRPLAEDSPHSPALLR